MCVVLTLVLLANPTAVFVPVPTNAAIETIHETEEAEHSKHQSIN